MSEVAEAEKPKQEKRAVILDPGRMKPAEYLRQDWVVNAEAGTTPQDVLDPQFWAHMAAAMEPFARIDVRVDTGEWLLELLVLEVGRNWARVHQLHRYDLVEATTTAAAPAVTHRVEWKGPHLKWSVIRNADGAVLMKEMGSKAAGEQWLEGHLRASGT